MYDVEFEHLTDTGWIFVQAKIEIDGSPRVKEIRISLGDHDITDDVHRVFFEKMRGLCIKDYELYLSE